MENIIYFRKKKKRKYQYNGCILNTVFKEKIEIPKYIEERIQETYNLIRENANARSKITVNFQ